MTVNKKLVNDMKSAASDMAQDAFNKGYFQAVVDISIGLNELLKELSAKIDGEES